MTRNEKIVLFDLCIEFAVWADESDLRFLDRTGTIAGLIAKGKAKKSTSGFCVAA